MTPITALLLTASTIYPVIHSSAIRSPYSHPTDFLVTRQDLASSRHVNIGDVLEIRNGQLFRKRSFEDDENNSTAFEPFAIAREYHSYAKRLPGLWPDDADEDDNVFTCKKERIQVQGNAIDTGSSGQVYEVIRESDGSTAAVKSMATRADRDNEFSLLQKIGSHPNIVEVYDSCDMVGGYGLLMEKVLGQTMDSRMGPGMPEALVKVVIGQVATAMTYFHGKGVAHNDIKGANVMFGADDAIIKVIDFGEATTDNPYKRENKVEGGIASPEAEKGSCDPFKNDVWELGVLTVKLLNGVKPWAETSNKNSMAIWNAPTAVARSTACKKEWPKFTKEFCDILAGVFCDEGQRKSEVVFAALATTKLLEDGDECDDKSDPQKTTKKRSINADKMEVIAVEETEDEWILRAVLY